MSVSASIEAPLEAGDAFDTFVEELVSSLAGLGMEFDAKLGVVTEKGVVVGRVISWQRAKNVLLEWHPESWNPERTTKVHLNFEPIKDGTLITVRNEGWGRLFGNQGKELTGWFSGEVASPLLRASSPDRFGDWLIDRRARRPSGAMAREVYRDPLYHRPNFLLILKRLSLGTDDYLLEVGCGGGAFLKDALRSGCRAAAIDHSPEMVRLARLENKEAIDEHRLDIIEGDAASLPYGDRTFSCAVMTGVFHFLPDPERALGEIRRVLKRGGRFVAFMGSKELRGTPAAPEPAASRIHFYEDSELVQLARKAGFVDVTVERPNMLDFAREVGVPQESLELFDGRGGQLLIARAV